MPVNIKIINVLHNGGKSGDPLVNFLFFFSLVNFLISIFLECFTTFYI